MRNAKFAIQGISASPLDLPVCQVFQALNPPLAPYHRPNQKRLGGYRFRNPGLF